MGWKMSRFEGKRIIVTGAGSGFGEATAARFAKEGGRVLVTDVNEEGRELRIRESEALLALPVDPSYQLIILR